MNFDVLYRNERRAAADRQSIAAGRSECQRACRHSRDTLIALQADRLDPELLHQITD
jgi:hypothetical protein